MKRLERKGHVEIFQSLDRVQTYFYSSSFARSLSVFVFFTFFYYPHLLQPYFFSPTALFDFLVFYLLSIGPPRPHLFLPTWQPRMLASLPIFQSLDRVQTYFYTTFNLGVIQAACLSIARSR